MTVAAPKITTLVIFDIDGTLIDSTGAHHQSLTAVLRDFGLDPYSKPWADYHHYTDSGVLDELLLDARGRGATEEELSRLDRLTQRLYASAIKAAPIVEIAGATMLLDAINDAPDMAAVFATGSMRGSASVKLSSLGLDAETVVLSTGSEHLSRADIVTAAISAWRAKSDEPVRLVALGDGRWDEVTASVLAIPFIGIQTGLHIFDTARHSVFETLSQVTPDLLRNLAAAPDPDLLHI
jgi:phosphoglycolate phosphatase-like HAD superfamily hydrolase